MLGQALCSRISLQVKPYFTSVRLRLPSTNRVRQQRLVQIAAPYAVWGMYTDNCQKGADRTPQSAPFAENRSRSRLKYVSKDGVRRIRTERPFESVVATITWRVRRPCNR